MQPFDEHEILRFDIQLDIHMSSVNYEGIGNGIDLDLLAISY